MDEEQIKELKDTYKWLEKVESGDKIPTLHQWMVVSLLRDMHRRLKDLEE